MYERDWKLYFEDIFECIKKIEDYKDNLFYDDFIKDNKTVDAVV